METRSTFKTLFFIKKHRTNSKGEAPVYLRITVNKQSSDLSIHRFVKVDLWDSKNGTVRGNSKQARLLNDYMLNIRTSIFEKQKHLLQMDQEVTANSVRNAFLGIEEKKGKMVIELFQEHNENIKKLKGIDFRVNWA